MILKMVLVIAACAHPSLESVQSRLADLRAKNPGATVSYRIDKRATCTKDGQILTGRDAKLAEVLK